MTRCKMTFTVEINMERIVTEYSGLTMDTDRLLDIIKKSSPTFDSVKLLKTKLSVDEEKKEDV